MEKKEVGNLTVEIVNTLEKKYLIMRRNEENDFGKTEDNTQSENEYEKRIICETNIKGLLQAERVIEDGKESFHYNISTYQNLKKMARTKEFRYQEVRAIVESINMLKNRLGDFLLDADKLIFYPEYVFYDRIRHEILYCFNPDYNMEISESLMHFSEFIMQYTDHSDEGAMEMIYGFYKKVCEDDYSFEELLVSKNIHHEIAPAIDIAEQKHDNYTNAEEDAEYIKKEKRGTIALTLLLMVVIFIGAVVLCILGM